MARTKPAMAIGMNFSLLQFVGDFFSRLCQAGLLSYDIRN